jgi:putative tricarboxylic transport membrane protein
MSAKNIAGALALILFGIAYGFLTSRLPERTLPNTPGPPFFPWILTVCLLILAGLWLIQTLRERSGQGSVSRTSDQKGWARSGGGLLMILGYLIILPSLGFLFSTPILFGLLMWQFGERRLFFLCLYSIVIPLCMYGLFKIVFQVPLPVPPILG